MAKLPPKKPSVGGGPRPMGPKLPPVPSSPVNQPATKMPKPKKPRGPMPSSGMPAQMGTPPVGGGGLMA